MEQDINLIAEQFKKDIISQINTAGLPPVLIYYTIKDVFTTVETSYSNYLREASLRDASMQPSPQEPKIVKDKED